MTLKEQIEDLISEAERPQKVKKTIYRNENFSDEFVDFHLDPENLSKDAKYVIGSYKYDDDYGRELISYTLYEERDETPKETEARKLRVICEFIKGQFMTLLNAELIKDDIKELKKLITDHKISLEKHEIDLLHDILSEPEPRERKAYERGLYEGRKELEEYKRKIKDLIK